MPDLSVRSIKKELLDGSDIPFADIRQNMAELNTINTWLGGHSITCAGLKALLKGMDAAEQISVCEIGCGGGDNLEAIRRWCEKKNIAVRFTGIDIKPECIAYAQQQYPGMKANWMISHYKLADLSTQKPDILFSSLFCHHFTEAKLVQMLMWMKENSRAGFFINDLHRHPLAYHTIGLITRLFSRSYLVKHDAPLSVARGFTRKEWSAIFKKAGIMHYSFQWRWAFRHLIIFQHEH